MHHTLSQLPRLMPLYIKALTRRKNGLQRNESVPSFSAEAPFSITSSWLTEYKDICHWPYDSVPLLAAQVYAAPIHTYLLAHNHCPVPMLGLVHAGNHITCHTPLALDTPLTVKVWFGATRWKAKGYEFDLHTAIKQQDDEGDWSQAPWQACTSIFRSVPKSLQELDQNFQAVAEEIPNQPHMQSHTLSLEADLGRRYGKIAGDRNPIHLYPWSARLFGFKKPIIHGMWTLARSLSLLVPHNDQHTFDQGSLTVRFKKPISLPSEIETYVDQSESTHTEMYVLNAKKQLALKADYNPNP